MMLAALGYDFATCTVCAGNAAQKTVLTRAGWARLAAFVSSKTGDHVELWGWRVTKAALSVEHDRDEDENNG